MGSEDKWNGGSTAEKKLIIWDEFLIVLNSTTGKLRSNLFITLAGLRVNLNF